MSPDKFGLPESSKLKDYERSFDDAIKELEDTFAVRITEINDPRKV